MTDRATVAIIRIRRSTSRRIAWVALAKRLVAQDEMLFSRWMRMLLVRCALAKRYFRTQCMCRQATGARGAVGQPAGPASQILPGTRHTGRLAAAWRRRIDSASMCSKQNEEKTKAVSESAPVCRSARTRYQDSTREEDSTAITRL